MTPLAAALAWLQKGFSPLPIPTRSKGPILDKWQELSITAESAPNYFNGASQNIGVLLGDRYGSVDADCDCQEAIVAAAVFLPETRLKFGRPSKPCSHYFYRVDPALRIIQFKDPTNKKSLFKLRGLSVDGSIGHQTVVPPGIHETGEPIRFEQGFDGDPANVEEEVLVRAGRKVAAVSLLARHWPKEGSRHDAFLALAGVLVRAGWTLEDTLTFHRVLYRCLWPANPELSHADSEVQSTFDKYTSGAQTTGIPTLIELIDKQVVDVALQWLEIDRERVKSCDLPDICVNGRELRDVSTDALAAIVRANDPPRLFVRAAAVVRVDRSDDGRPNIVTITNVHLRGEMTRAANFNKSVIKKNETKPMRTSVNPPIDVARDILAFPASELRFLPIESITEAPYIREDGIIVSSAGYDQTTRTYYSPVGNMDGFFVPDKPTADDIDGAKALIEDAIGEFPFVDEASRANAFAEFITPELRPAIRGNVPMALNDAPQAGSGKTMLAAIVAEKSSGSAAAMRPAPIRDDDEWRKLLTTTVKAGHPLAIFDNVDSVLESPSLALALTARQWTDRILGRTEDVTLPQRTVFIATGNNIALGGDLPRRCYWIRLDAKCSEPWRNREFRHPDLRAWVQANRGRLLGAVLTLARAWFVAGCPQPSTPILGSFEEWCRTVGGILEFAGISGFLGNLDELYKQSDPTVAAWEAFLIELSRQMPTSGFKVSDVIVKLREDDKHQAKSSSPGETQTANATQNLRSVLPEDLGEIEPAARFSRRLGKAFLKRAGRRYGDAGVHLVRIGTNQGAVVWAVQATKKEFVP